MASAVLTSRNEPHWAEHKPYMTKYTTPHSQLNSRFNPNPNFSSRQVQNVSALSHLRQGNVPSPRAADAPPPPATAEQNAVNDRNDSFHREYVTYNLSSYSRRELKELKKRLISDLDRVRGLQNRIEAKEFVSRPNLHPSHYREGAHLSTAPQLQVREPAFETIPPNASRHYQNHEAFGGKSKNKNKLLSGQKRASTFASGGDPKRPVVVEDYQLDKAVVGMMRRCKQILTKLMKHKHGWVFNTPVDVNALGLDDYYDIVKYPMDLGTVKLRLDKNEYRTPQDFAADVRLTFNNAMTYNPKGQDVHALAQMLLDSFEEMFRPAYKKYEAEQRKVASTKQRNQSQPEPNALPEPMRVAKLSDSVRSHSTALNHQEFPVRDLSAPASVPPAMKSPPRPLTPRSAKLPKPKAHDSSKRPMEFEEKVKLGTSLQNLPPEKMDHVVHIVKMRNPNLAQEGDEIELDFEALDNETLWELDRFVSYHKKVASKMKRQGISEDAVEAAGQLIKNSPEVAPIPEHTMPRNKKGDVGEEDVDIGEDIPVDNFPPVQIEKDAPSNSSSSSSSGSDSSSSDSESGSSSGSDSDEDSVQSPYVEANIDPTT